MEQLALSHYSGKPSPTLVQARERFWGAPATLPSELFPGTAGKPDAVSLLDRLDCVLLSGPIPRSPQQGSFYVVCKPAGDETGHRLVSAPP